MISIAEAYERLSNPRRTESMAEVFAELSEADRLIMLEGVDMEALEYDWGFWGRPKQHIPDEPYHNIHLLLLGRGAGKTRTMSEWVRKKAMSSPGTRIGMLGRSMADTRDVMVQGESGVLNIPQPDSERPTYKPAEAKVVWPNGSTAKLLSAEVPDAVRGSQYHYATEDEFASHTPFTGSDGLTAHENLRLATRLGEFPTIVISTTPKRVPTLRALIDEAADPTKSVRVVTGSTLENKSNLSSAYMDVILGTYEGTALARQEIYGEMMDLDVEGALWDESMITYSTLTDSQAARLPLRVVGVDPSVAESPTDECGIVVLGSTAQRELHKRRAVVLEDASLKASPEVWAKEVVRMVKKWKAYGAVIESNQGFELLRMAVHNVDPTVRVFLVKSSKSKRLRAEPVSQIYEQKRITHLRKHPLLEDQMTSWDPVHDRKSPDRVDALVHGAGALLIKPPKGLVQQRIRAVVPSGTVPNIGNIRG